MPWSRFVTRWLVWTAAWSALLVLGYNTFKKICREVTSQGFAPEMKSAIQAAMPWSIGVFALVVLLFLRRPGRPRWRGRPWLALLAVLASQNLLGLCLGTPVLATLDLSLVLGASIGGAGWLAFHAGRSSWHALGRRIGAAGSGAGLLALAAALAVAIALGVAQIARQRRLTLHDLGGWTVTKMEQGKALIGAVACFVTRKAVARGRLDTSVWHGFQEVLRTEPIELKALRCRFALDEGAYLVVRFGAVAGPWTGVRLSRNEHLPSAWLLVAEDGGFLDQRPLAFDPGAGWQDLSLVDGVLAAGGRTLGSVPWPVSGPRRIGFRGGAHRALVDDIELETADGTVVRDGFDLPPLEARVFTGALAVTVLLGGLLATRRRSRARPALFTPIVLGLPVLVCVGAFALVDYWILAGAHPWWVDYRGFQSRIETEQQVVERLRGEIAVLGAAPRVVVLGSSQTWGAGARRESETWVRELEASLGPPWRCIGGAVSGATSTELFAAYRREWSSPAPQLVLVVLGNNDPDRDAFRRNLTELAAFQRERGVPTVLVLEPNSCEQIDANLPPNHRILREVGAACGVPVVDLAARLREHEDRGFLWWDHVHLSSCGQRHVARILRDELVGLGLPRLP